ncbi:hypothetical protein LXL04_027335 [Taraxacum kok-saghyz]
MVLTNQSPHRYIWPSNSYLTSISCDVPRQGIGYATAEGLAGWREQLALGSPRARQTAPPPSPSPSPCVPRQEPLHPPLYKYSHSTLSFTQSSSVFFQKHFQFSFIMSSTQRKATKPTKTNKGCHAEVERQRQSGANGDDVMAKARLLYHAQFGSQFNQVVFWRAVKDYEKWRELESFDQFVIHLAKKHKVSESTQSPSSEPSVAFNLNYDPPQPM